MHRWLRTLSPPERLLGVDVARALALLGMVVTHLAPLHDDGSPTPAAFLSGKSAALFAVLAGLSLGLVFGRSARPWAEVTTSCAARALLLGLLGFGLAALPSGVAVILMNYALLFLAAPAVLRLSTRTLAWLAPVWLCVAPIVTFAVRAHFDLPRATAVPVLGAHSWAEILQALTLTGYYPVLAWVGYLLVGVLLSRVDWRDLDLSRLVAVSSAAITLAVWAASHLLVQGPAAAALAQSAAGRAPGSWGSLLAATKTGSYGTTPTDTWWWLAVAGPHTSTPFDMLLTSATSVAAVALCVLAVRGLNHPASALWVPLVAAGSMPLTLYTTHVVLLTGESRLAVHVSVLLVVATVWRLFVSPKGPLERAVGAASAAAVQAVRGLQPHRGTGTVSRKPQSEPLGERNDEPETQYPTQDPANPHR